MTDTPHGLALAFVAGLTIGLWYFGGLWLTVQRLTSVRQPALLLLGSFLVRALTSMWGFSVVLQGSGACLIASLLGFLVVRTVMVSRSSRETTEPPMPQHTCMPGQGPHVPRCT